MHDNRPRTFVLTLACTIDGDPVLIPASTDPRYPRTEEDSCPTLCVYVEQTGDWEEAYEALLGKDVKVTVSCKCPPYPNPHWQTDGLAEGLARPTIIDHETTCPNFPRDVLWQLLAERVIGGLQVLSTQIAELLEPGRLGTAGALVKETEQVTLGMVKAIVASLYDDVFEVEAGGLPESMKMTLAERIYEQITGFKPEILLGEEAEDTDDVHEMDDAPDDLRINVPYSSTASINVRVLRRQVFDLLNQRDDLTRRLTQLRQEMRLT